MPDPWMPGLIRDPGKGAGYKLGHNRMRLVCIHATAGNNSYAIVKDGVKDAPSTLAQFLVPYEGVPWQFTEVDAICYDSPPNDDGPGIEIERPVEGGLIRPGLSEFRPMSDSQVEWTGKIVHWLNSEWGVPLDLYDGPRVQGTPPGFRGFANHGDIDSQRSDGVTREEWGELLGLTASGEAEEDDMKPLYISKKSDQALGIWATDGIFRRHVGPDEWAFVNYVSKPAPAVLQISDQWWETLPDAAE